MVPQWDLETPDQINTSRLLGLIRSGLRGSRERKAYKKKQKLHQATFYHLFLTAPFLTVDLRVVEIIPAVHQDSILCRFIINPFLKFSRHPHPKRKRFNDRTLWNDCARG